MKIEHRNIFTPTDIIKHGGLKQVQESIKRNFEEVFVVRSSRNEEEIAIMSVAQAEQLFDLKEVVDELIDEMVLNEFHERKQKDGGLVAIEIPIDPSVTLSDDERYVSRRRRREAGVL